MMGVLGILGVLVILIGIIIFWERAAVDIDWGDEL